MFDQSLPVKGGVKVEVPMLVNWTRRRQLAVLICFAGGAFYGNILQGGVVLSLGAFRFTTWWSLLD